MANKETKATIHFAGDEFFIGITPSKKYCSVAATLRGSAEIVTSYEIVEEDKTNGAA